MPIPAAGCKVPDSSFQDEDYIPDDQMALDYANQIDFTDLKKYKITFPTEKDGLGWSDEKADKVEALYKRWLYLKRKFKDDEVPPTDDIGMFWQCHVLDTMSYYRDTAAIIGVYLHYSTYTNWKRRGDFSALNITRSKYRDVFGEDL
jgi:hypothetical protein